MYQFSSYILLTSSSGLLDISLTKK